MLEPVYGIGGARCLLHAPQFAAVIHNDVDLEPVKPPKRCLAALGNPGEDVVLGGPSIMADSERCGINERKAAAAAKTGLEVRAERYDDVGSNSTKRWSLTSWGKSVRRCTATY